MARSRATSSGRSTRLPEEHDRKLRRDDPGPDTDHADGAHHGRRTSVGAQRRRDLHSRHREQADLLDGAQRGPAAAGHDASSAARYEAAAQGQACEPEAACSQLRPHRLIIAPRNRPRAGGGPVRSWLSLVPTITAISLLVPSGAGLLRRGSSPDRRPHAGARVALQSAQGDVEPRTGSTVLARLRARRPITDGRTVLPVLEHRTGNGHRWLLVRLPGRPNGRTGWITRRATLSWRTSWHVVVSTSARRRGCLQARPANPNPQRSRG